MPESLHALIAEAETLHAGAASWTLTWLEGRARCSLDDALVVGVDRHGVARVEHASPSHGSGPGNAGGSFIEVPGESDDPDDDDAWLR